MLHPFETLKSDYASWIDAAVIRPECEAEAAEVGRHLVNVADHFLPGCKETNVPIVWAAPSFQREASCDFRLSPAQGDRWDAVSIHVPAHLGPYPSFTAAQIAAYKIDGLDKVTRPWTLELALYYWEIFNGLAYRDTWHIRSPYDVGGLTIQQRGKYIADRKFAYVMDAQLGCLTMYLAMVKIAPSLALPREAGIVAPPLVPSDAPIKSPIHELRDMSWTQSALDEFMQRDSGFKRLVMKRGGDVLRLDGDLGKKTRTVVRAFEEYRGLDIDAGIPAAQVIGALDQILGPDWKPAA